MKNRLAVIVLGAALVSPFGLVASHIRETLTLAAGWNAVYLESTPVTNVCAQFFKGLPVTSVGAYVSDAYSNTRQYHSDGTEIGQKPVSFMTWHADDTTGDRSDLVALAGGSVYLIFATNACTTTFDGAPVAPTMVWRAASDSGEGILNFAAPSLPAGSTVSIADYYAEGPVGASGKAWQVGGTGAKPNYLSLAFLGKKAKLTAGKGYMMTSERVSEWPGVIGLSATGGAVDFGTAETTASATLVNDGTTTHVFRVTVDASTLAGEVFPPLSRQLAKTDIRESAPWTNVTAGATWDVTLEPGVSTELVFGLARSTLTTNHAYGAVLRVNDLGKSAMQARLAITASVAEPTATNAAYPTGLWFGKLVLTGVSEGSNRVTTAAAGTMKPTVLLRVDDWTTPRTFLLQQVSVVQDTNRVTRMFKTYSAAKTAGTAPRRYSSLIVDPAAAPVLGAGDGFGKRLVFTYAVASESDCNPFRHAWHPDHDGIDSYYKAKVSGELWSITNTLTFAWQDDSGKPIYETSPEGQSLGYVNWRIDGLKKEPIFIDGAFAIERVLPNSKLEE